MLDHMVALLLVFLGISILVSIVAIPIYITSVGGFLWQLILPLLLSVKCLYAVFWNSFSPFPMAYYHKGLFSKAL